MKTERSLKIAITKAKNKLKDCNGTLAEKIELKSKVKQAEKELHDFKLNYFDRQQQ
jgi:hypothetical protein